MKARPGREIGTCKTEKSVYDTIIYTKWGPMALETITSRKNTYIRHVRELAADAAYRREQGEYLCDGMKTLREAISFGARIDISSKK